MGPRDSEPSWRSTDLSGVKGTTYHTVPRVRDWHCLHHQVHPCCLWGENREYVHQRVPRGMSQDTMNTQYPEGTSTMFWIGCWCRSQTGPTSLVQVPTHKEQHMRTRPTTCWSVPWTASCPVACGHSKSFSSNLSGLLKKFWKVTPSGLGDNRFSLSLDQPPTPTSHQGVVLLEMGPIAAEALCQGGLAHCWISCEVGEENHHCRPDLTTEALTPEC